MPVHTARDLGLAVRARRLARGWSQQQLANRAGTSRKWLSELERGKPSVELTLLLRTLEILGLRLTITDESDAGNDGRDDTSLDLDDVLSRLDQEP